MPELSEYVEKKLRSLPLKDAAYQLVYHAEWDWDYRHGTTRQDRLAKLASIFSSATPAEIERAYAAAEKLDQDHMKYLPHRADGDYEKAITIARNKARAMNPGFSEDTYFLAALAFGVAMR